MRAATSKTTALRALLVASESAVAQSLQAALDPTAASQTAARVTYWKQQFVHAAMGGGSRPRAWLQSKRLAQVIPLKAAFAGLFETALTTPERRAAMSRPGGGNETRVAATNDSLRGNSVRDNSGVDRRARGVITNPCVLLHGVNIVEESVYHINDATEPKRGLPEKRRVISGSTGLGKE